MLDQNEKNKWLAPMDDEVKLRDFITSELRADG